MSIEFRPLLYALGAEVRGLDLTRPIGNACWDAVRNAFLRYGALLVRGQRLTREQHIGFSRRFGDLDPHELLPMDRHPQYPELLMVTNDPRPDGTPSDSRYTGQLWHSDLSFTLVPALGSLLRAVEVPLIGGDTMFAKMSSSPDQTGQAGHRRTGRRRGRRDASRVQGLHRGRTGTVRSDRTCGRDNGPIVISAGSRYGATNADHPRRRHA